MSSVPKAEATHLRRVSLVRRAYLLAVWLWLLLCLVFPNWMGKSYHYDEGSEEWSTSGAFGISGSGNFIAISPLWNPPRSSGGFPTVVRWPLAPIEARNNVEIHIPTTLGRFIFGLFFAGLVVLGVRWTTGVGASDRVLFVASAISVAILIAILVLAGIGAALSVFALTNSVVFGVLCVAIVVGIIVGAFIVLGRVPSEPSGELTATGESRPPDSIVKNSPALSSKTSLLSSMWSLNWWWRIPAYLVFQFFLWMLVASPSWPVGRDVVGPYQLAPVPVVIGYWLQFILLPFFPLRFKVFGLSQLLVIVLIYILPDWPRGGNTFNPFILVPASIWSLFWTQFIATLIVFWRAPYWHEKLTKT